MKRSLPHCSGRARLWRQASHDRRSMLIRSVAALTGHARLELQGERQQLLKEALRARMLAGIGIRRTRSSAIPATPEE